SRSLRSCARRSVRKSLTVCVKRRLSSRNADIGVAQPTIKTQRAMRVVITAKSIVGGGGVETQNFSSPAPPRFDKRICTRAGYPTGRRKLGEHRQAMAPHVTFA